MPNLSPKGEHLKPFHFKRGQKNGSGRGRVFDKLLRTALTHEDRLAIIANVVKIARGEAGKVGDQLAAARFLIERIDGKDPKVVEHDVRASGGISLSVDSNFQVKEIPALPQREIAVHGERVQ